MKNAPKVTSKTLMHKIHEGVNVNGWSIIGIGGTQTAMLKPLIEYLRSKGVEVDGEKK